jgi:hypothetical protein
MKTQKKKQILTWTTVTIAMLMMMIMIDKMPIVNSLASSSNSLLSVSNLVVIQQQLQLQYQRNHYRVNNNNNMQRQRQRRSLTSLSSLSYYATIGSATSIGGDEIEIPPPSTTRTQQQQQHNSSYPLVEVLGVVSDETEDDDEPTMIYSATATATATTSTSNSNSNSNSNILINTWNKIKSSMKFDKQAIIGLGFDFGLTYNFISNINGSITLSVAWYIASMKVRENTILYSI